MRCEEIMKREVLTTSEDESIQSAAQTMARSNVGFLPVVDESEQVIGTITDRDITIRAVAEGHAPQSCLVADVMSREVVACRPSDDLEEAGRLMAEHHKSRILVIDDDGGLCGVLSLSDIAQQPQLRAADTLREVSAREAAPH
jgi:CBS domain-containing protein